MAMEVAAAASQKYEHQHIVNKEKLPLTPPTLRTTFLPAGVWLKVIGRLLTCMVARLLSTES